jgi:hypothetical protein
MIEWHALPAIVAGWNQDPLCLMTTVHLNVVGAVADFYRGNCQRHHSAIEQLHGAHSLGRSAVDSLSPSSAFSS